MLGAVNSASSDFGGSSPPRPTQEVGTRGVTSEALDHRGNQHLAVWIKNDQNTVAGFPTFLYKGGNVNKKELKLYSFLSTRRNYAQGQYDFVADDIRAAIKMAKEFQEEKNKGKNENYTIKFNLTPCKITKIKEGFFNIFGRSEL